MQAWLEYAVRGLVDRPEAVTVTPVENGQELRFELRVHPGDVGKLVGKQGTTIKALRALLQVGSAKQGRRYSIDIVEDAPPEAEIAEAAPDEHGLVARRTQLHEDPSDRRGRIRPRRGGRGVRHAPTLGKARRGPPAGAAPRR